MSTERRKVGDRVVVAHRGKPYTGTITHVGRVGYEVLAEGFHPTPLFFHRHEVYDPEETQR